MRVGVHYAGSEKGARETAEQIVAMGSDARTLPGDLTDPATGPRLVEHVHKVFGSFDVLVNSAAVMLRTPVGEVLVEDWDAMFALNLRAPFFLCQAAARAMRDTGGAIVNIADLAAFETWRGYIPHSITKAGIVQMTRALAHALAPRIRVNAIAPGPVLLPEGWTQEQADKLIATTPLGRLGSPDDVAQAVLYLLSADYVTGETIIVDGGRHIRY
jgi:pteridine reductase